MASIYTRTELITMIKDIDKQLMDPVSMSKVDTGQSETEFRMALETLRKQRETLVTMLNSLDAVSNNTGIITLVNKR